MSDLKRNEFKLISGTKDLNYSTDIPVVPTRNVESMAPPEIPPKRYGLKTLSDIPSNVRQVPPRPPLPKKPNSSNSEQSENLILKPLNVEQTPPHCQNFNPFVNTSNGCYTLPISSNPDITQKSKIFTKYYPESDLSPSEGAGSASDALRGIESGLRNMEKAMKDQLKFEESNENSNSIDEDKTKNVLNILKCQMLYDRQKQMEENPGLSMNTNTPLAHTMKQHQPTNSTASIIIRDSPPHNVEYPPRLSNIDHHLRSLDRNLPLELQYSKHRQALSSTSQTQQNHNLCLQLEQIHLNSTDGNPRTKTMMLNADMREQIRQQLLGGSPHISIVHNTGSTPGSAAAAALLQHQAQSRAVAAARVRNTMVTREEIRMRRRSSHDETVHIGEDQYSTAYPGDKSYTYFFCILSKFLILIFIHIYYIHTYSCPRSLGRNNTKYYTATMSFEENAM